MNNPQNKKKMIIVASVVFIFVVALTATSLVLALNFKSNVVLGNWLQTGAGLGFTDDPGPKPDFVEFKNDKTVTWYADENNRSNDYMVGTYTIVEGNKTTGSEERQIGDSTAYTITIKPQHYLDESGKDNKYSGPDLEYVVYKYPKEPKLIYMISVSSLRGYQFEKQN